MSNIRVYDVTISQSVDMNIDDIEFLEKEQLSFLMKKFGYKKKDLSNKIDYKDLERHNRKVDVYIHEQIDIDIDKDDIIDNIDEDDIEELATEYGIKGGYNLEKYQDTIINDQKMKLFIENIDNISLEDIEKII
jgi:hypothetical protein